jgi:hypothetical protein
MNTDFSKPELVELIFAADEKRSQLIAADPRVHHDRILNLSTAINELKARLKHSVLQEIREEKPDEDPWYKDA